MGVHCIRRVLLVFLLAVTAVWAQQDRGTFTGTTTDPTGAVIPGVKITITNTASNAVYESVTNDVGQYRVPNLPIGNYKITFESQGFKSVVREGLVLSIGQVARIDAELTVGSTAESIEVRAEVPLLQTETPEVGTVLNTKAVNDLPLGFAGGRYAENFAYALTPGVSGNNWQSRINGSPAFSKAVVLDGADATIYIGGQFGESSPSMEAFEEFKVQTSGMSAEYGRTGGGVFNFVMKSGTNQIHGSALGLIHNEWADANSLANNRLGNPKQRDRRNDWGGSFGGPVYIPKIYNGKDKTFFYVAYERYVESYAGGGSPTSTLPQPEFWTGDLSRLLTNEVIGQDALGRDIYRGAIYDPATTRIVNGTMVRDPFPGNIIPTGRISGPAQKLSEVFNAHYKPINNSLINNALFPVSNQAGFTQNQFSVKGDHYVSNSHKINGSFAYIDRPRILLDQGGVWDFSDPNGGPLSRARLQWVRSWYGRFAYDWTVSPTVLNHLQLGFNRQRNPSLSKHLDENGVAALGLQGFTRDYNYPEINFGSNDRVNFPTLGYTANDFGAGQAYELIDTATWIHNRHSIKAGVDYRQNWLRWRTDSGPASINFGPGQTGLQNFNQTGNGFASMLLGDVASASVPMSTPTGSKYLNFALFLQDDFKVSSRLTLNLGIRWDYQPLPVEQYDRLHNFNTTLIDPMTGLPGAMEFAGNCQGCTGTRNFGNNSYKDFSPRIGMAYQITDKTVVRAAYGIFYLGRNPNGWSGVPWGNTAGWGQINQVNANPGYAAAYNWNNPYPGVVVDTVRTPSLASGEGGVWGPVHYDANAGKNGYVQQWNLNIQRELPGNMVFDIGYVGSKGTGIMANELSKINQINPKYLALGDDLGVWTNNQAGLPASVIAAGGRYPYGNAGTWIPSWQTLTPFPQIIYWSDIYTADAPLGFTTYNALQVQLNKRFSHGLNFMSNYTFSKSIDNVQSAFGDTWGMNWGRPMDYYNRSLDKSISDSDRTHTIKIGAQYDLPFGKGRRFGSNLNMPTDFALGGWTIQYIGNYTSGWPLSLGATGTPNSNFATNRPLVVNPNGESLTVNTGKLDFGAPYINTSLFVNPTTVDRYARGNSSFMVSQLRAPWMLSDDFSLQKNFYPIGENRVRVQFRAEFLNLFNRHHWGSIDTDSASPTFGQVTGLSDWFSPRKIQFGIRADF